jgi:hypothetical protein
VETVINFLSKQIRLFIFPYSGYIPARSCSISKNHLRFSNNLEKTM